MSVERPILWNPDKNIELMRQRGISFEEILSAIGQGGLLMTLEHPNKQRNASQKIWVVGFRDYAYLVPFVESEHDIFLKTIMPSRKATKQYLNEPNND